MGNEGREPCAKSSGNKPVSKADGAESGAVAAPKDERLVRLLECWAELPESVRVSVDAIVSAHIRADDGTEVS